MGILHPGNTAILLLLMTTSVGAGTILFLTFPMFSHLKININMAEELAKQYGHNSTIVVDTSFSKILPKEPFIDYIIANSLNNFNAAAFAERTIPDMCSLPFFWKFILLQEIQALCKSFLADDDLIETLIKKQFDAAVIDSAFVSGCFNILAHNLSIPRIQAGVPFSFMRWRIPFMPSITSPDPTLDTSDETSFIHRLINTLLSFVAVALGDPSIPFDISITYLDNVQRKTTEELHATNQLILYDSDPVLDNPLPMMPNVIQVGGLSTRTPEVLTDPLRTFMDSSTDGVIIVSFGGSWSPLPPIIDTLIAAFKQLPSFKFVLKHGNSIIYDENIIMLPWIPQNDLLSHSNTKAFISHCGHNGLYEALYNAVPIIGLPLLGDQFQNARQMQKKGFGIILDVCSINEKTIVDSVNEILKQKYKSAISKASNIFHSRPMKPSERAAFWIDHVIRYGGEYLRPSYLPFYQYYLLDVLLCLFVAGICGLILFVLVCTKCYRLCFQWKRKQD